MLPQHSGTCLWVAEHVQKGETFKCAAIRGLQEELGITLSDTECQAMVLLWDTHKFLYENEEKQLRDFEIQQTWGLCYNGSFKADLGEVAEAKFFPLGNLREWFEAKPEDFTPWFCNEMKFLRKDNWSQLQRLNKT